MNPIADYILEITEYRCVASKLKKLSSSFEVESALVEENGDFAAFFPKARDTYPVKKPKFAKALVAFSPKGRFVHLVSSTKAALLDMEQRKKIFGDQGLLSPENLRYGIVSAATGLPLESCEAGEKDFLITGVPTDALLAMQDLLVQNQIYPVSIAYPMLSLVGKVRQSYSSSDPRPQMLVLDVGRTETACVIVGQKGVSFARSITSFGLDAAIPVVQKELGVKDQKAAEAILYSNQFDLTPYAATIAKKIIKELQSSIGFYEVQTGQSVGLMICPGLPGNQSWLKELVSKSLGLVLVDESEFAVDGIKGLEGAPVNALCAMLSEES